MIRFQAEKKAEHPSRNVMTSAVDHATEKPHARADRPSLRGVAGDLRTARPSDILNLQRMMGNRAVTHLIQAKLIVGPADDAYEQEADRMSDHVMRMADSRRFSPVETLPEGAPRYEDEEVLREKPSVSPMAPGVQFQSDGGGEVKGELENRLVAGRGGGSPLPADVRTFMESRFGADFGSVRLHTDGEAVRMNRELNAQAFTHGRDIYMGEGRHKAATTEGKRLLAHELTHVLQQGGAGTMRCQGNAGVVRRNGVAFPSYNDIVADGTVKAEANKAWQETRDATTEETRREQSFWIRWKSDTSTFSASGHSVGPAVKNKPPAGASVTFSNKPADSGNEYTVGMFHTHTPTTYWTAGYQRNVGPSGVDVTVHNDQGLPGVVYDYEGRDGKIGSGHPLNSAAKLWHCGPNKRT